MLNRGHTVLPETLRRAVASGKLAHLKCDRMHQRERFARLVAERGPWDLVVDFVGFERQFTLDAVRALRGTGAHFVHISTDSVRRTRLTPQRRACPRSTRRRRCRSTGACRSRKTAARGRRRTGPRRTRPSLRGRPRARTSCATAARSSPATRPWPRPGSRSGFPTRRCAYRTSTASTTISAGSSRASSTRFSRGGPSRRWSRRSACGRGASPPAPRPKCRGSTRRTS